MVEHLIKNSFISRPRRLRLNPTLRAMVRDVLLTPHDFIQPLFVKANLKEKQPILSMPGCFQLPLRDLEQEAKAIRALQIPAVILFGIPDKKDAIGSSAWKTQGIVQQAITTIKSTCPELVVIADCCFCEYTDHGHCGVLHHHVVDNDATLPLLARQAVSLAKAGADIIAPSGMMDGMVRAIRESLDEAAFSHIPLLSYAIKYASHFYGPFREAAEGAPQVGDRKSYQMDYARRYEWLKEVRLDVEEGADMVMVKPAGPYLDIITRVKQTYPEVPLAAYQVSGEYAMIKAAAERGWVDEKAVMMESLMAIKRAGADVILSYFAKEACAVLNT